MSTNNKKVTKKINLKVSCALRESTEGFSCPDIAQERAAELDIPHIMEIENDCDQEPCDFPNTSTYQTRREKEFDNWKEIRESLLTSHIEEEGFLTGEKCCFCGIASAEFRCPDCGKEQYLCQSCANSTHETRNYFHVLEKFKVSASTCVTKIQPICGSVTMVSRVMITCISKDQAFKLTALQVVGSFIIQYLCSWK